ncbi:efflux RND transporter periplasmic adaptor subunit [Maribacter sp. MAR_2009_72]|uniref:efflux RND transporter periplasmic adaptor subunit n=1 Tax=Maribacter sp. MAR_2009_72 TaxID=1250050 RepID=UPI00119BCA9C|nr:efflux RND transporter periplasmic adaptor subunit [Maribacter sp. MAR_2009_72]TVZ14831.1 cobalt-zinc-cadmium efflux system membrane fusion protein [Maribacter sp. MAR_2009_72]
MQKHSYKILNVLMLAFLVSCGGEEKSPTGSGESVAGTDDRIPISQEQFDQNNMKLDVMKEMQFPVMITTSGMIDVPPENRAVVSATMGGYIKRAPLLVGDRVRKGQLLVTIENPEFVALQQKYMEIHGQLSYLQAEYDRQQTMIDEKISSQKSFLKAQSDYKTAVATYNGLRKQLSMMNISTEQVEKGNISSVASIFAPIAGSITKVNVSKGTYVSPEVPIMEIINNDHIHLELSVFEKDIMNIKKGQMVEFKIPESSRETFKAQVHLVGTSIDQNRTIKVHAHLENEEKANFLTGMFVEANIITESTKKMALPTEAISIVDDQAYILVLDDKLDDQYYFKRMTVTTNGDYNEMTALENLSGDNLNRQFLTKGAFNLMGE